MKSPFDFGCNEYRTISRRRALGVGGGALLSLGLPLVPNVAYAKFDDPGRDVLVCLFLRGGVDGLSLIPPFGDAGYYKNRPTISIARPDSSDPNRGINLDGFFMLPPAMASLHETYLNGQFLVVHATGSVSGSRSHFDAQRNMEVGKPDDLTVNTGWLGRHLASTPPMKTGAPLRGVALNYGLDRGLAGGPNTLPIPDPSRFDLAGNSKTATVRRQALAAGYSKSVDPLKTAAANTQKTIDLLQAINFTGYTPSNGAVYPNDGLGHQLRATAALIKAQLGVEAVYVDVGGWDTHSNQGPVTGGMAGHMKSLAESLTAFARDVFGSSTNNVTVVAMSEFGRNVHENASHGNDHGHGSAMLVLGPKVRGGRVLTNWPGLGAGQLYQNQDLAITIDHRDILAEIVAKRLNDTALDNVFPGYSPTFHGVF